MNKIRLYIKDTITELVYKVSWPTWEELQSSAIVVMVASLIIAMIVWVMDQASDLVMTNYYHLFD
jgi:preprotein translocase subunit SecE